MSKNRSKGILDLQHQRLKVQDVRLKVFLIVNHLFEHVFPALYSNQPKAYQISDPRISDRVHVASLIPLNRFVYY